MRTDAEYVAIKNRAAAILLGIPGVHAVGLGNKEIGGVASGQVSIRVLVTQKKAPGTLAASEIVPSSFEGVPTDVVEVEPPTEQVAGATGINEDNNRYRPLRGGVRLSRTGNGSGTLGCLLTLRGTNRVVALTNHHVVFPSSTDTVPSDGTQIYLGQPEDVASCFDCCRSRFGSVLAAAHSATADAAVIELSEGERWLAEVEGIGTVTGTHTVTLAQAMTHTYQVQKRGFRTRLSGGTVREINLSGTVYNADGTANRTYTNSMRIVPNPDPASPGAATVWSAGGDSGSAVLNSAREVAALHYGGNGTDGFAIPIEDVLSAFRTQGTDLEVATATVAGTVQTVIARSVVAGVEPPGVHTERQLEHDLANTPLGLKYTDVWLRNLTEVNELVNHNRRVTVGWHRSGGAALFQTLIRVYNVPKYRVPDEVAGRQPEAIVDSLYDLFMQYGSPDLRHDLSEMRAMVPQIPPLSSLGYNDLIGMLQTEEALVAARPVAREEPPHADA
jgi:hypothetical protein